MTKTFNNNVRKTGFQTAVVGVGNFTVNLTFCPDYLKAKFATQGTVGKEHDGKASTTDFIYWELAALTPTTFVFTVHYSCVKSRDIQWVATQLPKDAEIIAH